jgi:hypothetical protein
MRPDSLHEDADFLHRDTMRTVYPELDLDLSWQPVASATPEAFTPAQIEEYNERGYVSGVPLFKGDRLRQVQQFFEDAKGRLTGLNPFTSLHHEIPELYDFVTWERTASYLRDLLGPNVICHVSQYNRKETETDSKRSTIAHQDATFNPMHARCAIVWVAIDRAFVENGCMWFFPGTHKLGVVECLANHHIEDEDQYGESVPIELEPGQAVIFSDLLIHTSPPNRSHDTVRGGFTATYAPAELVPTLGRKQWAVLCCGEDRGGHWNVHPRPDG